VKKELKPKICTCKRFFCGVITSLLILLAAGLIYATIEKTGLTDYNNHGFGTNVKMVIA
jgi:hypothetical protein